jgi:hypothetical protein
MRTLSPREIAIAGLEQVFRHEITASWPWLALSRHDSSRHPLI